MAIGIDAFSFRRCGWEEIGDEVTAHYTGRQITVDSFWETHVRESAFYRIERGSEGAGWLAIHKEGLLTLFNVAERHGRHSQELFARALRHECVREALVPTGDEFLMSHALDRCTKFERQAYFSLYGGRPGTIRTDLSLRLVDIEVEPDLFGDCAEFMAPEAENIRGGIPEEIYAACSGGGIVGFGVVEYQRIVPRFASIGMIVRPADRRNGYAAAILSGLRDIVESKGRTAVSGCWYYNHNSKKSMEAAGASSRTRLIRFSF